MKLVSPTLLYKHRLVHSARRQWFTHIWTHGPGITRGFSGVGYFRIRGIRFCLTFIYGEMVLYIANDAV